MTSDEYTEPGSKFQAPVAVNVKAHHWT